MRPLTLITLLSPAWAALASVKAPVAAKLSRFIDGQYIVISSSPSSLKRSLESGSALAARAQAAGVEVVKVWDSEVFSGALVTVPASGSISDVYSLPDILQVYPVRRYPAPNARVIEKDLTDATTIDTFSTHTMTGVDVIHNEGYYGKGMFVGIIDTGVDYTHPALGGCFGKGCKIAYGVVPQATLGMYKVFGCQNAAGDSYTSDQLIIEGLIGAYNDGADVITLSLGGQDGWSEGPAAVVASNIVAAGRAVTIAMANTGTFYSASPASGTDVWAIGSVDNSGLTAYKATVAGGSSNFTFYYYTIDPLGFSDLPIYALSNISGVANTGDACDTLPASTPDLSGYVVVAKRGTCLFTTKFANIAAAGGKYLLLYNNEGGEFTELTDSSGLLVAFIYQDDGAKLVPLSGTAARVSADDTTVYSQPYSTGGKISSYSTYGPNYELDTQSASLSAPGGNIFSTLPGDTFGIYSGTSMATPFVAGSAALYWSIKGRSSISALALRDVFCSTAVPVANQTGTILESVVHQGGGLINVLNAVTNEAVVSPGYLLLNDTAHFNGVHTIKVTNTGKKSVVLPISHLPAGTALTFETDSIIHNPWPVPLVSTSASVKFSKKSLTIKAGGSASFTATFTPPKGLQESQAPIYSGFIALGTNLTVPYYGLASKLHDLPIFDHTTEFFGVQLPALVDAAGDFVDKGANITISKSAGESAELIYRLVTGSRLLRVDVVDDSTSLSPSLTRRNFGGHGVHRMDSAGLRHKRASVGADPLLTPVPWVNATALANEKSNSAFSSSFDAVATVGLIDYEPYIYRNNDQDSTDYFYEIFDGTVYTSTGETNTTVLPAGSYKILLRALKVTGKPEIESEYESWLSPTIFLTD
ncbi:hypothetical protein RQP46_007033 [Phenoliferia psychrophenolica]